MQMPLFVVPRSSVGIFSNIANHDACDVLHALDALLAHYPHGRKQMRFCLNASSTILAGTVVGQTKSIFFLASREGIKKYNIADKNNTETLQKKKGKKQSVQ